MTEPAPAPITATPAATGAVPLSAALPSATLFRLATGAAFASSISMRVCDPMLPALAREFGVGLAAVSPVIGFFAIAYGVMQLVLGPLGERFGMFRVASLATVLAGCMSLACSFADGLATLIAGRVATGAAAAGIIPILFAWIGERVPYELRQVSIARIVSGTTLGIVFGQALGGIMVDTLGWRWAFVAQSLLFLMPGLWMLRLMRHDAPPAGQSAPVAFSVSHFVAGYRGVLANPWARKILLIVGLEGLLFYAALALLPSALHARFGIPLWQAGLTGAAFGLGGFAYTWVAPRLLRRFGEIGLVRLGWVGLSIGLVAVTLVPGWLSATLVCLASGVFFYCQHNTLQTHGTQMDPIRRGTAMAAFASIFFAGQAIGVPLASAAVGWLGFNHLFWVIALALAVLGASLEAALRVHQGGGHALAGTTGKY